METPPFHTYEFGDFCLNWERRLLLRRDGTLVPLTPRVFDTLLYLVENSGVVLDKEVLMEAIWPDSIVEENNLSQNISNLRRVLGDRLDMHRYIVTITGRGFRFVAPVKKLVAEESAMEADAAVSRKGEADVAVGASSPTPRRHLPRHLLLGAVIVLLLVAAFAFWRLRATSSPTLIKTMAVLPFKPLLPANADPILEVGMADTLITKLGSSRDLIVRPLSSVRKYGAPEQDPMAAGRALEVEAVLDGSIQRRDSKIRITAG